MDATSETTLGSLLNRYAQDDRKTKNRELVTQEIERASKMDVSAASFARWALCSPRRFPILVKGVEAHEEEEEEENEPNSGGDA